MKTKRKVKKNGKRIFLLFLVAGVALAAIHYLKTASHEDVDLSVKEKILRYAEANGLTYEDYPESLIALLERNPETEKFVLEYPTASKQSLAVDLSEYETCKTVPLFLQWDQRWGYMPYGSDVAGLTACGPVCLSMAAYYLTKDPAYSPDNMIRFASENGYYVSGSGSSWTLISEGAVTLGFTVTEIPLDENRIRKELEAGNPIICAMGPGDFTSSGHFIVITGTQDGFLKINDPNSKTNSQYLWQYAVIKDQIRNLWSIAPGDSA